jgi:hypothetical protein
MFANTSVPPNIGVWEKNFSVDEEENVLGKCVSNVSLLACSSCFEEQPTSQTFTWLFQCYPWEKLQIGDVIDWNNYQWTREEMKALAPKKYPAIARLFDNQGLLRCIRSQ